MNILGVNDGTYSIDELRSDSGHGASGLFTTCAWFHSTDAFLKSMACAGIVIAVFLFIGFIPLPDAIVLYVLYLSIVFFFNVSATSEIYTLSLHDALPI